MILQDHSLQCELLKDSKRPACISLVFYKRHQDTLYQYIIAMKVMTIQTLGKLFYLEKKIIVSLIMLHLLVLAQ